MVKEEHFPAEIKERIDHFYIRSEAGYLCFGKRSSVYVLVPSVIREILRKRFGIDLRQSKKEKGKFQVSAGLTIKDGKPILIYEISPPLDKLVEEIVKAGEVK